jgi:DNA-binding NarL/FixJ family response regulator
VTDELIPVLNAVGAGRVAFNRNDADTIRDHMRYLELGSARNVAHIQNGISTLTVREKEVFPLLADGYSIKTTARTLGISPKTVETHKYHIMKKLNLDNMADFTKLAMIKDLIPI